MNVPREGGAAVGRTRGRAQAEALPRDEAVRARIAAAALSAFAERGFHGTSIPEIAQSAGVGVASIYRRFESKERLVNAVFRETKTRLRDALLLDLDFGSSPRALFIELWSRLVRFYRADPVAFQFLEMHDHVPYLDSESRAVEQSLLRPIMVGTRLATSEASAGVSPAVRVAMVWGAFVGITKAERLGYLAIDDESLLRAGEVCFAAIASKEPKTMNAAEAPAKGRRARKGE